MEEINKYSIIEEIFDYFFAPFNHLFWFLVTHAAGALCALLLPLLLFLGRWES